MKSVWMRGLGLSGLLGLGTVACATDKRETADETAESTREAQGEIATTESNAAARIDRALKALERGGDAKAALAELEAVVAGTRTTLDEQDDARLGVSSARETLGDKDGAIEAIEELLQSHGDSRFESRELAEKRLRKLLTGKETGSDHFSPSERYAPVARALAPNFAPDAKNQILVDVYAFGDHGSQRADELGIFNVPAAKRDLFRESCSFCEQNLDVGKSISRAGSWTAIPRAMGEAPADMPQIDRSMLVFYFDLGDDLVPERYDEYLPIPSAEIVKHLERGEGLIAFRERPNAKPTIVIAAPRVAQLDAVQEAFAKLTEMPKAPLVVNVAPGLRPDEIQSVIRSSKGELRACYETLLESDPKAAGSLVFDFVIAGDGTVSSVRLSDEKTTLKDVAMGTCATDVVSRLRFPATGSGVLKVSYPLSFSPS
jgi:hypothetical protein